MSGKEGIQMHATLDPESKSIIEHTLTRFVAECYDPAARRARLVPRAVDYRLHWPALAELGVLGLPVPEALGGLGGSARDLADALHTLAPALLLEPYIDAVVIAGSALAGVADAQRAEAVLAELVGGECITVLLGGRSAPDDDVVCGAGEGGAYRLSGSCRVVPFAAQADRWLVAARDAGGQPLLFEMAAGGAGVDAASYRLLDGRSAADVHFDGALVEAGALLAKGEAARQLLARAGQQAVSALCADAVGVMQALVSTTTEYLRTRSQFGAMLGSFQALQHRLADMHMAWLEARSIAGALAASLDGVEAERATALQFAAATVVERNGRLIGHEAIQLHGGMGATDELMVSHWNARLAVCAGMARRWLAADARWTA